MISVLIPAYNAERTLPMCLDSVLSQTLRPDEVIVVDDGSRDRTADIADHYGVRCYRLSHQGIATTRNAAVACSTGDCLAFIDADDVWTRDKLYLQMEALRKDPGLDMVFGWVCQFRGSLEQAGPRQRGLHAGTMLTRRSVFDRIGVFDESLVRGEFIDWFSRADAAGCRHVVLQDVVMYRRLHEGNFGRGRTDNMDLLNVVRRNLQRRRME